MSNVLVYAEHAHGSVPKAVSVALAAGKKLAGLSGGQTILAVVGSGIDEVAKAAAGLGADKVVTIDNAAAEHALADISVEALKAAAAATDAKTIVFAATSKGKDIAPRLAAALDASIASDITGINDDGTLQRPMWAGNVFATVELSAETKVVSVRTTAFDPAEGGGEAPVEALSVELAAPANAAKFVSLEETKSDRPVLTEAERIVSGGRGLKSAEQFAEILNPLCDALGAALGASRAVVDAGFVPNDLQIGQTGKVVAPTLYFAIGISGAIQHLAGMKDSKVICAINKDEEAPIFSVSDFGLVADLFQAVPELTEKIKAAA